MARATNKKPIKADQEHWNRLIGVGDVAYGSVTQLARVPAS